MRGVDELQIESDKNANVRLKFISQFIKGKISLNFMETILTILRKLEYLKALMKSTKKKK
jgi:hypothetical protein